MAKRNNPRNNAASMAPLFTVLKVYQDQWPGERRVVKRHLTLQQARSTKDYPLGKQWDSSTNRPFVYTYVSDESAESLP